MLPALGSGIVSGFGLALISFGFAVIYRGVKVINFAAGPMVVIGGYLTWWIVSTQGLSVWVALAAVVAAGCVGGYVTSVLIGPLARATLLQQVMLLVGLSYLLTGVLSLAFGSTAENVPGAFPGTSALPGLALTQQDLFIIGGVVVILALAFTVLYKTPVGLQFRAAASHAVGAQLMGINPRRVAILAWVGGTVISMVGGWLYLPNFVVSPDIGQQYLFQAFAAAVIGGFGSLTGAVVGGLVLGIGSALVAQGISAAYTAVVPFVVMVVVLSLLPKGLTGERA